MPMLGYGVYQISQPECEQCVREAIEIGYRSIDTAQAYHNEEAVGRAIAPVSYTHLTVQIQLPYLFHMLNT